MCRLLLIACSQRKNTCDEPLRALDRYDGPAFRVLRKFLRQSTDADLTIAILSAKFGLIVGESMIPNYECRMTTRLAAALRPQVLKAAKKILTSKTWRAVGICAGKDYQLAMKGLLEQIPEGARVDQIRGGLGTRLTELRKWLHSERNRSRPEEAFTC